LVDVFNVNGFSFDGLRLSNSPGRVLYLTHTNNVFIGRLHITLPPIPNPLKESFNTDGIDINTSDNVLIDTAYISAGDDDIAVKSGTSHITVQNVHTNGGHGLSFGGLGKASSYECAQGQMINCIVEKPTTTDGLRVKVFANSDGYIDATFTGITVYLNSAADSKQVNTFSIKDNYSDPKNPISGGKPIIKATLNNVSGPRGAGAVNCSQCLVTCTPGPCPINSAKDPQTTAAAPSKCNYQPAMTTVDVATVVTNTGFVDRKKTKKKKH